VAPSVHASGESISWEREGDFGVTTQVELSAWVSRVAAIALLAKHYPQRNDRHNYAFALAGWLGRAGLSADQVTTLYGAIGRAAEDRGVDSRIRDVKSTFKRLNAGNEAVLQRRHLVKLLGANGEKLVSTAALWLGVQSARSDGVPLQAHEIHVIAEVKKKRRH
jgi:hypothetical protein